MASKRCLPTRFFKDPDIMNLESHDARLILIGLVLLADDEGRELAHAKLLSRELDYPPEQIERTLGDLDANGLITLYLAGKHRYYSLRHWHEWQTLSKPAPSKYPAPPAAPAPDLSQGCTERPEIPQGNPGKPREISPEGEENRREDEENRGEGEEEATPPNIVTFPTVRGSTSTTAALSPDEQRAMEATKQVSGILKLAMSPALARIVSEYLNDPTVSLLGEADAAREYIDDPRRNRKGQRLTPAFFRRWLKREREDYLLRHGLLVGQATGTLGKPQASASAPHAPPGGSEPLTPSGAEDPYRAFVTRRTRGFGGSVTPRPLTWRTALRRTRRECWPSMAPMAPVKLTCWSLSPITWGRQERHACLPQRSRSLMPSRTASSRTRTITNYCGAASRRRSCSWMTSTSSKRVSSARKCSTSW